MKPEYAYIGIKSCGCCVAATVDDPKYRDEVAKDISEFIKSGYYVERVKIDDAKIKLSRCIHDK